MECRRILVIMGRLQELRKLMVSHFYLVNMDVDDDFCHDLFTFAATNFFSLVIYTRKTTLMRMRRRRTVNNRSSNNNSNYNEKDSNENMVY